ncbi:MAG: methyltransferase domain-containing protein [Candidatus Brocadiales bacterium]
MNDSMEIRAETVLYRPESCHMEKGQDGTVVFIDPEGPNWIGTDAGGAEILNLFDGTNTFGDVVRQYSARHNNMELSKAWLHVHTFARDALRHEFLSTSTIDRAPYEGRSAYLSLDKLNDLWIHTNDSCNLTCAHCLVDSSPSGNKGLPTGTIIRTIDEARGLGVTQFYLTGGEPFVRQDFFELVEHILRDSNSRLTILTNGTLLDDHRLRRLKGFSASRLNLQISLDGSSPEINDPARGNGSFPKIIEGIRQAVKAGLRTTVSTVITSQNVEDIWRITKLLPSLGVCNHHLLFMHHRGRVLDNGIFAQQVPISRLVESIKNAQRIARETGVTIDNLSFVRMRVDSPSFTRYDLSNACWDSLCLYSDGEIYPSAALAGYQGMSCGNINESTLEEIWKDSPVCKDFRRASLHNKPICRDCHLRFICGGGDIEHSYLYSITDGGVANLSSMDPYCELYKAIIPEAIHDLADAAWDTVNLKSGFNAPVIFRGMGEGATSCTTGECKGNDNGNKDFDLRTLSSNCVLSSTVEAPRHAVREFYAHAAADPQEELCCASSLAADDVAHIPNGVLERAYGCGSPVTTAGISEGERVLDLGSGAGIDCFIAAKKVGPSGMVIGVDMTDEMLDRATDFKSEVARNLGYDVVDFRKGFLEEIPAESGSVDIILSNCVINLSPDKKQVFREMWRVLRDHGRIVVSDIVSDKKVPEHLRADKLLWGQCLSGALTEEEFLAFIEQAGFYGTDILSKTFWQEVEDCKFFSITIRGYKYEKRTECNYRGHKAVYLGPLKAVIDEEGHLFPKGEEIEVCTDTAEKLKKPPYSGRFIVIDPSGNATNDFICKTDPDKDNRCCG